MDPEAACEQGSRTLFSSLAVAALLSLSVSPSPTVSVLVLCQDNLEMLSGCLVSIARTIDPDATPYEILVLFQQTSRESALAFLQNFRGARDLHAPLNLGFGSGNNFAAHRATGKYLLFLNDDSITQGDWLGHLVCAVERDAQIGGVGSRLLFPDGVLQEAGAIVWSDGSAFPVGRGEPPGSLAYSYARDVDYASANGLLVRRDVFDAAGGFDERFFPGYYEDVDLCMTIRHKLGLRIVYEPRSRIVHRESATSGRDPDFRSFLFRRHQSFFCDKWADVLPSYPAPEPESPDAVERAVVRAQGNPRRVLVVDDRVPRVGMGSGFGRTADLLTDLSEAGFAVAFAPTDRRHLPIENALGGLGIDLITEPLLQHLRRPEKRYDAVVISRPHNFRAFYSAVREALPSAALIYDVEALYHRRLLLQMQMEKDSARRNALEGETDAMLDLEVEIARSADRLVGISDSEVAWLESVDGHADVDFMRPLALNVAMQPIDLSQRTGAVFIAGWLGGEASPNVSALRWYANEVLPRVRAVIPDFVTRVSGANPPLSVQCMACDGLQLLGFIESADALYRAARVAVSPVLAGAGVKIKTIEALQYGVPVVATSVGAEGLGVTDGGVIDISDDPAEYASRVIALATDDALWLRRREALAGAIAHWKSEQLRWPDVVERALQQRRAARAVTVW